MTSLINKHEQQGMKPNSLPSSSKLWNCLEYYGHIEGDVMPLGRLKL